MIEKLKNLGNYILGIAGLLFLLLIGILMIKGSVWIGEYVVQWLINLAWIALAFNLLILLPLALFRKTAIIGGIGMVISSYVFGLTLWFYGLLLTYFTWGLLGVFVGLVLAGVGVVPVAMLATLLNSEFFSLLVLVVLTVLTFGTRALGTYIIAERVEERKTQ